MSITSLTDAKRYVNFKTDDNNTDLQSTIDEAEAMAAHWVGPLAPTAITERFYDATNYLSLTSFPIISVTSVTGSGNSPVDLTTLDIDLTAGTIYPDIYGWIHVFPLSRYTVVYQAGWASVPADIKLGLIELMKYLWQPRKGGGTRPASSTTPDIATGPLPPRVMRYWGPYIPLGIG